MEVRVMRNRSRRARVLRFVLIAGSPMAALVVISTIAFACTSVMGPLSFSPTSGPSGTVIMTSAQGLKVAPAQYALHFAKASGADCMSFKGVVTMATIATSPTGTWSNVSMRIPAKSSLGTHAVCAMEVTPVKGATGSDHDTFTVT